MYAGQYEFRSLTITGGRGALLWGDWEAVTLRQWAITKQGKVWALTGTIDRVNAFRARQRPLLFTAPRAKGFWAWGVESITIGMQGQYLEATLGPPEQ